nr:reverse transcriptase domain-containing protein [Tanacetum cinerariifolium]
MNEANMKAMQTQIDMVKNELRNEMKSFIQTSLSNQTNESKNMMASLLQMNIASTSSSCTLPSNTVANPKSDLKAITTRSGVSYDGPQIPPLVVENEPEATKETVNPTNNGTTEDVQPQTVQSKSPVSSEPVIASVSASKPNPKALIPYPYRRNDERNREKAKDQIENFYQIFKDMTRTPLNENCSAVLLKKLPEKLGDPGKFLIPCDFPGMAECLALADLDASINLMPLSVWKKLSLPDLTPTCMTLELADRSISRPVGVAEDVYVKVGSFHFSADFVVVDFDADPRVPLILERSFLKTGRDLIDVFEGELTLRVGKEAITFNLDQTSRYSTNCNDMTAKRIDVIDMAFKMSRDVLTVGSTMRISLLYRGEYSQWVERFMNYLEEQTDGEAMINSIKNGQIMWSDQEKRIQKIDRLARSLLIQGLSNDIYSLIDSNKTAKDLWDALAKHMLGSEYGEQDRKTAVLYEYETFKATEGKLLLDTYIRYLQVINDLKKCVYSKDNCELNFKLLNNLQLEWKQYATIMRQNKNLMVINIDALYNILK